MNNQHSGQSYSISDLLKGKDLDIIAASLLLIGKLKVDSVQLFRDTPIVTVSLIGQFKSTEKPKEDRLAKFLEENSDVTLTDLLEGMNLTKQEKE
ncbi:hypothetical protein NSQ43_08490 [Sporosarcina sp. FSL W8-0480]|uniref:hypothetical protein n=1 Tax=Sporosarcina sp. FSL W8-0480 TaxID=2954701 RepID=UPI0030D9BDC5